MYNVEVSHKSFRILEGHLRTISILAVQKIIPLEILQDLATLEYIL